MEKIDVGNIMDSCANAIRLRVFDWIKPPKEIREKVEKEQLMYKTRLDICNSCTILNNGICDSSRSIIVKGEEKFGCGCLMKCKAALEENYCTAGKW